MMGRRARTDCLFDIASSQLGHFTTAQAKACGYSASLLTYHVEAGSFYRIYRGVYRLTNYPTSPEDGVAAVWLAVGKDDAVISHESALELLDLSDVIPRAVHVTVPRSRRNRPRLLGVNIHTTTTPIGTLDTTVRHGIRLTSVERTILDAASAGTGPEQIAMAIKQAVERGLTTRRWLENGAQSRSERVRQLVRSGLAGAQA